MKKITIKKITLRNWRGEKERTTVFHPDAATYICGDNGLGKSRHFDAFCWLLFGKDSKDRKDFNLRTYDADHKELHHCECSVEAVIGVDGQDHTLKREYKEQWVKPRGQVEEVFKGNVTECTWDGVPVRVGDYQKRVSETIIDDTVFKMITNPRYFAEQMKWQQQREVLMLMAGAKSDYEIAADNADFKALLDELNGKSLSDFRKELAVTKKRLKAEAAEIEPRIDQTQKMMPETEDWKALGKEAAEISGRIANVEMLISDAGMRKDEQAKQRNDMNGRIYECKRRQTEIIHARETEVRFEAGRLNEHRRELEAGLKNVYSELTDTNIDLKRSTDRTDYLSVQIECTEKQLSQLREEWHKVNDAKYDEKADICPCCGQRLPEDQIKAAHEKFVALKRQQLDEINAKGKQLTEQKTSLKEELQQKNEEITRLRGKADVANDKIDKLTNEVMNTPEVKPCKVYGPEIPEWAELEKEIDALTAEQNKLMEEQPDNGVAELRAKKADLQRQLDDIKVRLRKRDLINKAMEETEALTVHGRELAQRIADVEQKEYIAAQFSKKRIEDCEQRINGMFKIVRFKLFDYTQDGNEYETCMPITGGVPYQVANTATQLNAGLDIINTLCRFNNVSAPIFVDGAESVNRYTETESQVIFLQVTKDKELVVR